MIALLPLIMLSRIAYYFFTQSCQHFDHGRCEAGDWINDRLITVIHSSYELSLYYFNLTALHCLCKVKQMFEFASSIIFYSSKITHENPQHQTCNQLPRKIQRYLERKRLSPILGHQDKHCLLSNVMTRSDYVWQVVMSSCNGMSLLIEISIQVNHWCETWFTPLH